MKQRLIDTMEFIADFKKVNGYAPTRVEIGKGVGVSHNTSQNDVAELKDVGYLTELQIGKKAVARSLAITDKWSGYEQSNN